MYFDCLLGLFVIGLGCLFGVLNWVFVVVTFVIVGGSDWVFDLVLMRVVVCMCVILVLDGLV